LQRRQIALKWRYIALKTNGVEDDVTILHVSLPPLCSSRGVEFQTTYPCPHHVEPVDVDDILRSLPFMPKYRKDVLIEAEMETGTLA